MLNEIYILITNISLKAQNGPKSIVAIESVDRCTFIVLLKFHLDNKKFECYMYAQKLGLSQTKYLYTIVSKIVKCQRQILL